MKQTILTLALLIPLIALQPQTIYFNDGINEVYYSSSEIHCIEGDGKPLIEKIDSVQIYLSIGEGFSYIHTSHSLYFITWKGISRYSAFRWDEHVSYSFRFNIEKEANGDYWGPFVEDCAYMQTWPPYNQVSTICPKQDNVKVITILFDK